MEALGAKLHSEALIILVIVMMFLSAVFGYVARLYSTSIRVMERESDRDRKHDKELREKNEQLLSRDVQDILKAIEREGFELRLGINELNRNGIRDYNALRAHIEVIESDLAYCKELLEQKEP